MIHYDRTLRTIAVLLAILAGFVDAIGFLRLGGMFVSFMSGNSTRLAIGLATRSDAALVAASLIAAFVGGVVGGSLLSAWLPNHRKAAVLASVAALLALAATLSQLGLDHAALPVIACAMGCANTVFQRDGEVSVGVTYMTGALVKTGQRIGAAFLGGDRWGWLPYLSLWIGLVSGGVLGALCYGVIGMDGLWVAALAAALLAAVAGRTPRPTSR
ncbi:YoaK family protein [Sphingomonas sp. RB3P16]|uniref:YoaK family protein n=1 Tax=Parasphingomonas frigoris TaxID=3096163 RepID=UPI002FC88196